MGFQKVGVIGAGQMGAGIAQVFAVAGTPVRLYDVDASFLERGIAGIGKFLARSVSKEKMTQADADAALGRIEATPNLAAFNDCDLVVEAIVEDAAVKKAVFQGLQKRTPGFAIMLAVTEAAAPE